MKRVSSMALWSVVLLTCSLSLPVPVLAQETLKAPRPSPKARPTPLRSLDLPDLKQLLEGVDEIGVPGRPGALAVWGDQAFPIVSGRLGNARAAVVAGGRLGEGRFTAFAHDGYLRAGVLQAGDTGRLVHNCLAWAGKRTNGHLEGLRVGTLGTDLTAEQLGLDACVKVTAQSLVQDLERVDVLIVATTDLGSDARARIGEWLRKGGGLLAASTGWGWQQLRGGITMIDHPMSRIIAPAGVAWTCEITEDDKPDRYIARNAPVQLLLGGEALTALEDSERKKRSLSPAELEQAVSSVLLATAVLPKDDAYLRPRIERLTAETADVLVPSAGSPLSNKSAMGRVLLTFQVHQLMRSPEAAKTPHPAALIFPGSVPSDSQTVSAETIVDMRERGRHSTGLYATPGGAFRVRTVNGAKPPGDLRIRIGAHTDQLWSVSAWRRVPEISWSFRFDSPDAEFATPFGGLVYVDVISGGKGEPVKLQFEGLYPAPRFVLGKTTPREWKEHVRSAPGPWAELETDKVIVTVPSEHIRTLDDPEPLMRFWNDVLDAAADLAGRPRERERPERFLADVQISAGYMHSGYPIMTHLDAAPAMVSLESMKAGQWGLFHELGHNHQDPMWTFKGTGEVTCNLFTLYILETVCKQPMSAGHDAFKDRERRMGAYFAKGAKFEEWCSDPFLALFMYCQLREEFGWEPYKRVFSEYRTLAKDQRPQTEEQKRDQWMVRFSRAVGKNLGPFFQAWGVPTSDEARKSIADLPTWMPQNFPPQ